jgi:Fe2+ or Zn2+ uptake regulation protein
MSRRYNDDMSERNLKEVLVNLLHKHHLVSVGEILKMLETEGKSYNKTSVYRALDQMVADGTVCRQYFNENQAYYELSEDDHMHLVCSSCGKVEEAECEYKQPSSIDGFTVDHHHLTLVGVCQACKNQLI